MGDLQKLFMYKEIATHRDFEILGIRYTRSIGSRATICLGWGQKEKEQRSEWKRKKITVW